MTTKARAPRSGPVAVVFLLAVAGLLAAAPAQADAWQTFKQARDLVESGGDFGRAETLLRQAIAEEPASSRGTFRRYVPHYYLGRVLAQKGDCRGAVESWREEAGFGALKAEQLADMKSREAQCRKVIGEVTEAKERAAAAISRAREVGAGVSTLSGQPILEGIWNQGSPSFAERLATANRTLGTLEEQIRKGDQDLDLDALAAAEREARAVVSQLERLSSDASGRLAEVDAAMGAATTRLTEAEAGVRSLIRSVRDLDPKPPRLAAAVAEAIEALDELEKGRVGADVATLGTLADRLDSANAALRPLATGPPRALRKAAESYLQNDFASALETLGGATLRSERSRFHGALLEAASLHGAWLAAGGQAGEAKEALDAALARVAAFDPAPGQPSERFYAPGFRQLYADAVAAARVEEASGSGADGEGGTAAEGAGEESP